MHKSIESIAPVQKVESYVHAYNYENKHPIIEEKKIPGIDTCEHYPLSYNVAQMVAYIHELILKEFAQAQTAKKENDESLSKNKDKAIDLLAQNKTNSFTDYLKRPLQQLEQKPQVQKKENHLAQENRLGQETRLTQENYFLIKENQKTYKKKATS